MIVGIGVDCVQIQRIERSLAQAHFVQRVFSEGERALLAKKQGMRKAETAAGCFAAKEAFLKAAGTGIGGFALADIAALRRENGAPYLALAGEAAAYCEQNNVQAHLSITHEAGLAMAFVVLETQKANE